MNDNRKHLTSHEVEKLIAATHETRHEARDRCLFLLIFRHGLRVSEALSMNLSQVDLEGRTLHVTRLKKGLSTTHPLRTDECRALRAWLGVREKMRPEPRHCLSVSGVGYCRVKRSGLQCAAMARWQNLRLPPILTCYDMPVVSP